MCAIIDSLGDIGAALTEGKPASLARQNESVELTMGYKPHEQAAYATPAAV